MRVLSSVTVCSECGATVEYEGRDLRYNLGMPYFICPVCHKKHSQDITNEISIHYYLEHLI